MGDCGTDGTKTHPSMALRAPKHVLIVLSLDCPPWRTAYSMSGWSYLSDREIRLLVQSRDPVQDPGSYVLGLRSSF